MAPEHIHIISAGEKVHTAYPAAFRILPTITRTYVFADSIYYEMSSNPDIEKSRHAVRNAVGSVKEISASLSIPYTWELVFPPVYPSVRDRLTRIHREFPGARFTFDLSGGSKELCMALFAISFWLDGEVYSSFDEKLARPVPLPSRPVTGLLENPNYQTILALLLRTTRKDAPAGTHEWYSRQYIFKQLWSVYAPSRTKKPKPGDPPAPVVTYKKGRKPASNLTHGTFSTFMRILQEAGLVLERVDLETKREKAYQITDQGELAFRFFSDPATNSTVRMVLEKNPEKK